MRSKRVLLLLFLLCIAVAGLSAVELDYHVGVGISVPFYEEQATFAFPSIYGGLGLNLLPTLAVGAEYEAFGLYLLGYGFIAHMPKAYVKFDMSKNFTLTGEGGVFIPTVFSPDDSETFLENNVGFAGVRATLLFMYAEYLFLINEEAPLSLLSIGIAVKR